MNTKELLEKHNINPPCGTYVPPGWMSIVDKTLSLLLSSDPPPSISQIKQKFGGLRIYLHGGTEQHYDIVRDAEVQCSTACEECGAEGKMVTIGYFVTVRCKKHKNKA